MPLYAARMPFDDQELRTSFLTVVTENRRSLFRAETYAWVMQSVLQKHRETGRVRIHAYVLMPDHLHLLLTPAGDDSLEHVIDEIKGDFCRKVRARGTVWAKKYYGQRILTQTGFAECKRYIEGNPVRAGLAPVPERFSFSSASTGAPVDPCPAWLCDAEMALPAAEAKTKHRAQRPAPCGPAPRATTGRPFPTYADAVRHSQAPHRLGLRLLHLLLNRKAGAPSIEAGGVPTGSAGYYASQE